MPVTLGEQTHANHTAKTAALVANWLIWILASADVGCMPRGRGRRRLQPRPI
jgi:hypothetical protein